MYGMKPQQGVGFSDLHNKAKVLALKRSGSGGMPFSVRRGS